MYITTLDALNRAVDERKARREEIRERHQAFLERSYGIDNSYTIIPPHLRKKAEDAPVAILARQVASVCMEDVAFELGTRVMGLTGATVTFGRDAFNKGNHDKLSRVEVPWIRWSRTGSMIMERKRVTKALNEDLDGRPLASVECFCGTGLIEYHKNLRKDCLMTSVVGDISPVHERILMEAKRRPEFAYRLHSGKEIRCIVREDFTFIPGDRPPSEWYYPYYLSWFLDGTAVLFETYDNPIGEVSLAKKLFEKCMQRIEEATGFLPLVVKVPPLSNEMLYCNRHLLWRNEALPALEEKARKLSPDDTESFFAAIADTAMRFN